MDFPRNIPTNVHKLEGILFIQWAIYVLSTELDVHFDEDSEGGDLDERRDTAAELLETAEHELRRKGHHVLHDRVQSVLWVFDASGPVAGKDAKTDERAEASSLADVHGLKKKVFGSVRALDLEALDLDSKRNSSAKAQSTAEAVKSPANQRNGESSLAATTHTNIKGNEFARAHTPIIAQDDSIIYNRFVSAVATSIAYFLAKTSRYLPLSSISAQGQVIVPGTVQMLLYDSDSHYDAILQTFSISVQWLSSGILVIIGHSQKPWEWSRIPDPLARGEVTSDSSKPFLLTLAPLGYFGLLWRHEGSSATSPPQDSEPLPTSSVSQVIISNQWKSRIKRWLLRQGIFITQEAEWIKVQVTAKDEHNPEQQDPRTFGLLWPACLTFYKKAPGESTSDFRSWFEREATLRVQDALELARAWFLNRESREMEMKSRRDEAEILAMQVSQALPLEEDGPLFEDFSVGRRVDQTAAAAIYPTPPDGYQSQVAGPQTSEGAQDISNEHNNTEMLDQMSEDHSQEKVQSTENTPDPAPDAETLEYVAEGDDLFGDMDTEMFATTGITEADFSFFDEPNLSDADNQLEDSTVKSIGLLPDYRTEDSVYNQFGIEISGVPGKKDSPNEPSSHSLNESNSISREHAADMLADNKASAIANPESKNSLKALTQSARPNQNPSSDRILSNSINVSFQVQRGVNSINDSFATLDFSTASSIDAKYAALGKYATKMPEGEKKLESPRQLYPKVTTVPRLAINVREQLDDEDEDKTTDESPPEVEREEIDHPNSPDAEMNIIDGSRKRKRVSAESLWSPNLPSPTTRVTFPSVSQLLASQYCYYLPNLAYPSTSSGEGLPMLSGHDEMFIQVAQALGDQVALSVNLDRSEDKMMNGEPGTRTPYGDIQENVLQRLLPKSFPWSEVCDLEAYLRLGDHSLGNILSAKSAAKLASKRQDLPGFGQDRLRPFVRVFKIAVPHMRVQRGGKSMEVLATALSFWDDLGLSPVAGPKNVTAYCVFPGVETVQRGVESFLKMMANTYSNMRMGTHTNGNDSGEYTGGLVPVSSEKTSLSDILREFRMGCATLARFLSKNSSSEDNIVIYMVDSFRDPRVLPYFCAFFCQMREICRTRSTPGQTNELKEALVLRIVPVDFVASQTAVTLPSPAQYVSLAQEIYERCRTSRKEEETFPVSRSAASMFQLAEGMPKSLDLSLTVEPHSALAQTVDLHAAYTCGVGSQWLTVSTIDALGTRRWNASYCLGSRDGHSNEIFQEVAKEIWDTLLELVESQSRASRIFLVKDGLMEQKEIQVWTALASQAEVRPITFILLVIDPSPPLNFPAHPRIALPLNLDDTASYNTPASTPQTPDHTGMSDGPAPKTTASSETPDIDSSARLIDVLDESWGAISTFTLDRYTTSSSPTTSSNNDGDIVHDVATIRLKSPSAYLLRRAGIRDENGALALSVQIAHAENPSEALLKDVLRAYRALGTLTRLRGIAGREKGMLPWHVSAARRAFEAVSKTMRFKGSS